MLVPGLSLRALDSDLSVFDLAAVGAKGFREWAMIEPFAEECHCEIISSQDAATVPGFDTLNRAWLVSNMLNLLGHSGHLPLACSRYSWNIIAGHQKRTSPQFRQQPVEEGVERAVYAPRGELPRFMGQLLDYHVRVLVPKSTRENDLTEEDAEWIRRHFDTTNRLASECESFRYAIIAARDWCFSGDTRAAIARLWSGIEAIFGIRSELAYRLASLIASLLSPRGQPRVEKFNSVKKLYSMRSKAVHGAPLSVEALTQAMDESFYLLKELILHLVGIGRPLTNEDFETALFC